MTPAEVHAAIGLSMADATGARVHADTVDEFVLTLAQHGLVLTTRESYDEGVKAIRDLEQARRDAARLATPACPICGASGNQLCDQTKYHHIRRPL